MSSTRNKRKRSETDFRSVGRQKSREQRDAASGTEKKNEGSQSSRNNDPTDAATQQRIVITQEASAQLRHADLNPANGSLSMPNDMKSRTLIPKGTTPPNDSTAKNQLHLQDTGFSKLSQMNPLEERTRIARLQGMIAHRSSLRQRIRYCGEAATERLRDEIGANDKSETESPQKKNGDKVEITCFQEMTNAATLAAKRSRSDSDANCDHRRTSLSLRRGSSVGKRMNAALSSLAPGSAATQSAPNLVTLAGHTKTPSKENDIVDGTKLQQPSQVGSSPPFRSTMQTSIPVGPNKGNINSNVTRHLRQQQSKDQSYRTDRVQIIQNTIDGKETQTNGESVKFHEASNRQSSSTASDRLAMPMHLRAITESLPQNRLTGLNLLSSKTAVLRKQWATIERRLVNYKEQNQQKAHELPTRNGLETQRSLFRPKITSLPNRKLTHWDMLLQEMSWMATDFIEERKWKESVARSISSSIQNPLETLASSKRLQEDGYKEHGKSSSRDQTNQLVHSSSLTVNGNENKQGAKSACSKLVELTAQTYGEMTTESEVTAQKIGKDIAEMISNIGIAVMGTFERQHFDHGDDKFVRLQDIQLGYNPVPDPAHLSQRKDITQPEFSNDSITNAGVLRSSPLNGQNAFSFREITDHVDSLAKLWDQCIHSTSNSDSVNYGSSSGINVSWEQGEEEELVATARKLSKKSGFIVTGAPFCGKTHTTSSLLWQRRQQGPQILICPKNSMIKWKNEIEQMGDIRILCYSVCKAWNNNEEISPKANDVVICEFALLYHLMRKDEELRCSFETIIVDCRNPPSFFASFNRNVQGTFVENNRARSLDCSTEFLSTSCWNHLLSLSLHSNAAVLLVEHSCEHHCPQKETSLSQKTSLEKMAIRVALLVGPRYFHLDGKNIQRRVVSWARQYGNFEREMKKGARARFVLEKVIGILTISLVRPMSMGHKMHWEAHRCKMEEFQQSKYDACCMGVRGALSSSLWALLPRSPDSLRSTSGSLMLLRQHCIHAEVFEEIRKDCIQRTEGTQCQRTLNSILKAPTALATSNPAQSNSTLASNLIRCSAKLRELISILINDCGVSLDENVNFGYEERYYKNAVSESRKVAILATLPIARGLISLLLNALGVRHDLLEQPWDKLVTSSFQHQQILSSFNSLGSCKSDLQSPTKIIVSSPVSLSGWNQGLGIEGADCVILFDDDWTGRGEFFLSSMMSRIQSHKFHTRKSCKFIRLICEGTLEDKIFSNASNAIGVSSLELSGWPCDEFGFLSVPESLSEVKAYDKNAASSNMDGGNLFPAFRLTSFRHHPLADTLLPSRPIPVILSSERKVKFLPYKFEGGRNNDGEILVELALFRSLCHEENLASTHFDSDSNVDDLLGCRGGVHFLLMSSCPSTFLTPWSTNPCMEASSIFRYLQKMGAANYNRDGTAYSEGLKITHAPFDQLNHKTIALNLQSSGSIKIHESKKSLLTFSLGCNECHGGTSLLVYASRKLLHHDGRDHNMAKVHKTKEELSIGYSRMSNVMDRHYKCYSNIFATRQIKSFLYGQQEGSEPLMFLPPLLEITFEEQEQRTSKHIELLNPSGTKREGAPIPNAPNPKRLKPMDPFVSGQSMDGGQLKPRLDSSGGEVIPPKEAAACSEGHEQKGLQSTQLSSSISLPPNSANVCSHCPDGDNQIRKFVHTPRKRIVQQQAIRIRDRQVYPVYDNTKELLASLLQTCAGESKWQLDSMVLFVKKSAMQNIGNKVSTNSYDSNLLRNAADPHLSTLTGFGVNLLVNKAAEDGETKGKKKLQENLPSPQFTVPSTAVHDTYSIQANNSQASDVAQKQGYRHRLYDYFVSRSAGFGLSMFECVPYQVVVFQVKEKITRIIEKRESHMGGEIVLSHQQFENNHSEAYRGKRKYEGSNLPAGTSNMNQCVKNERETQFLQERQTIKSGSSLIGPRGGFLSLFKGMHAPSPPKQRRGVSLPMGVKVSHAGEEVKHSTWSRNADTALCDLVNQYGSNWILITKMMQRILKLDIDENLQPKAKEHLWWKSAETCQRHWESICNSTQNSYTKRDKVDQANHLHSITTFAKLQEVSYRNRVVSGDSSILVGRTSMLSDLVESMSSDIVAGDVKNQPLIKPNQSKLQRIPMPHFSILLTSSAQRRLMPIAIIGVGNGPKQNQTAHSHPSHLQSVQESVTPHWSDGRTELWPLQILDAADKQYTARSPSVSTKTGNQAHVSSLGKAPPGHGNLYPRVPVNIPPNPTQAGSNVLQKSRISGSGGVASTSHTTIAPKKSMKHNGLTRSSGKSNARSK